MIMDRESWIACNEDSGWDYIDEFMETYNRIYLPKPPAEIYVEGISDKYEPIPFADIEVKGEWLD